MALRLDALSILMSPDPPFLITAVEEKHTDSSTSKKHTHIHVHALGTCEWYGRRMRHVGRLIH